MKNSLKITDAERLILANQYQILAELEVLNKHGDGKEYSELSNDLRDGYSFFYDGFFDAVLSNVLDKDDESFVLNTLDLFSTLKASYDELDKAQQAEIYAKGISFDGFDGNHETELLGFVDALAKHNRFFTILDGKMGLNSHAPMVSIYQRQLAKWEELGEPLYPMSFEQIRDIAEARKHPTARK
ncbi:hypothetical protein EAY64_06145 [Aquitalea palustris]|uniref:YfbU family protein n=1 Tax=Aquitalea palustris TaxID=2480983 RepID=A0A454JKP6_9NEIS|nr:YfbU family protein [Aquitalea palustris]RMC99885.1 hypothetical protein EAY64_06145 [Aquitalea palustris]